MFVAEDGQLYGWGANEFGSLGKYGLNQVTPISLQLFPDGEELHHLACGEFHAVALTKSSRVYSWGLNDKGKVGE
jgi:alpha-tubulin suppressor-like RCC1 family protein